MTDHKKLKAWVNEMAAMCQPDEMIWIDGSEKEKAALEKEAFSTGEIIQLNQEKLPGCVYHRTALNDVARTEGLTFICTENKIDAGPTNSWMSPGDGYKKAGAIFKGSMKGRKMYVIPFSMGAIDSPSSKIGVELTDSIYVVLNMRIMVQIGKPILDKLGTDGEYTKCLHSRADLNLERRLILHFPEDNTIWSVGSGYGGNVLLSKKCLGLRIASFLAKKESWMAEHMLILGIEKPGSETTYVGAAFPSACGKTNLAMLIPPEGMKSNGYKVWTVGDDIAWMKRDAEGVLRGINPEAGFFGVAPGTNTKTNSNAMATVSKNSIFTNVLLAKDKTVWWEDGEGDPPAEGTDWKGKPWKPGIRDEDGKPVKGAHPNARFTAPISQCPSLLKEKVHPLGVPISAFIFGGRRAHLAPLVYEAFNWQHGVYMGASMASERTAAQYGKQGEVRRDPMAMLPFCGYNMGDYFRHWLDMEKKITKHPRVFHVNWFRQDKNGKFLWPGFSENLRILEWIIDRCNGKADAEETPIGYVPKLEDLNTEGLDLPRGALEELFRVDREEWLADIANQEVFFDKFGDKLPAEIKEECEALKKRLKKHAVAGRS